MTAHPAAAQRGRRSDGRRSGPSPRGRPLSKRNRSKTDDANPSAAALPSVAYRVRVLHARHELYVEMTLDNPVARSIRLECPTWVPGSYSFMPFGRDLFDLEARDAASGAALAVVRDGWQAFRIEAAKGTTIVTYKAYAYSADFSEPCGLVDGAYAVILGARYLHAPAFPGPCRVQYELPAGWSVHHPSGAARLGTTTTWDYPSYEVMLDTPVVMGNYDLIERSVKGTRFWFVFVDRSLGYEAHVDAFVDQVATAAGEFHEIFGSFPFEDYTFVLTTNPELDWGLEHLTSTMCGVGNEVFIDPEKMALATRVCAHELFHAWNVRRLRPAPLKQPDLYGGSFTEGLWVAEGFTRYYEFLACTRAAVYTPAQFFSCVVNYYKHLAATPAFGRVSAVDSSLAAYLNHSKYPGRCNNSIDYYDKGMLIAFDLDVELRTKSPADSLDHAFRDFYQQHAGSKLGYTTAEVIAFFEARHAGLGQMLTHTAVEAAGLCVETRLTHLGFQVQNEPVRYLGLMFNNSTGPAINNVLDDSPASSCGAAPDDVITRINGYPFSAKALAWVAARSDEVTLEVMRGHRALNFKLTPAERTQITSLVWEGSEEQAQLIRSWLHCDGFRPTAGQVFELRFYENFHGVEMVI
ncbi:MAG: PDZ domain-containing protein [Isosphaeraceae bacterium]|nr:PDZ domain-containing protein [Isosphaeraceae bacterium]